MIEDLETAVTHLIGDWILRMAKRLDPIVRPVFVPDASRRPRLVGSAVLLSVGSENFMLTAAHVLDEAIDAGLYLLGSRNLVAVSGRPYFSDPPNGKRANDKADVGFVALTRNEVSSLERVAFLRPHEVDPDEWLRGRPSGRSQFYFVIGYPASRVKLNPIKLTLKNQVLRFLSRPTAVNAFTSLGLEQHSHLLVEFDRKNSLGPKGPIVAPDPHGVSGGGAWRCDDVVNGHPEDCRLVAIMTEWHDSPTNALVGTRVGLLTRAISDRYPSLTGDLPLPQRTNVSVHWRDPYQTGSSPDAAV